MDVRKWDNNWSTRETISYFQTSMYYSVYYIKIIVQLPHKNRSVNSKRFIVIDTCEIIMNNHTCEVIDFISGGKSIKHSISYNNSK